MPTSAFSCSRRRRDATCAPSARARLGEEEAGRHLARSRQSNARRAHVRPATITHSHQRQRVRARSAARRGRMSKGKFLWLIARRFVLFCCCDLPRRAPPRPPSAILAINAPAPVPCDRSFERASSPRAPEPITVRAATEMARWSPRRLVGGAVLRATRSLLALALALAFALAVARAQYCCWSANAYHAHARLSRRRRRSKNARSQKTNFSFFSLVSFLCRLTALRSTAA